MSHPLDFLKPIVMDMIPTGSRVICNPAPINTDEDWVIMCPSRNALERELVKQGYTRTSKRYYRVSSKITTYRHPDNDLNLIVTDSQDQFDRWREATEIATQQNLLKKEGRIKLFELITGRNKYRNRSSITEYYNGNITTIPLYRDTGTRSQQTTSTGSVFSPGLFSRAIQSSYRWAG